MYSEMSSASGLHPSHPCYQLNQSAPMPNPEFGDQSYEQLNGQHHGPVNPSYLTAGLVHQNQVYGYGVHQSSITNNGPFSCPGLTPNPVQETLSYPLLHQPAATAEQEQRILVNRRNVEQNALVVNHGFMTNNGPFSGPGFVSHRVQEGLSYPLLHQPAATQAQVQQVPVQNHAEDEPLEVQVEPSKFPNSRARLIWTHELHKRFISAVKQLGGLSDATPKAMLRRMNVRGLTHDHLKSHLQRMRKKFPNGIPDEAITGDGIENNGNAPAAAAAAPEASEGEASSGYRPVFESNFGEPGSSLGSDEAPNFQQALGSGTADDFAEYLNSQDFNLC